MDSGDIAWMLTSTALVVFMVPGLALFYGGMVRSKNVLNMLMMNMYCIGIVPVVWVLGSYSIGNSPDGEGFFLRGIGVPGGPVCLRCTGRLLLLAIRQA